MLRIIALLLLIPLLDILVLIGVSTVIGPLPTILLVVLTGFIGMFLVRAEGRHTVRKIQEKLAQGTLPADELIDGGLLIASGAFLLTPGVVTDLLGFLLVIPFTRDPIRVVLKKYVIVPLVDAKAEGFATGKIYTAGFPGNDGATVNFGAGSQGSQGGPSGNTVDIEDDAYDIDDSAYDVDDDGDDGSPRP
jgi:UPF0716 protein FxsA